MWKQIKCLVHYTQSLGLFTWFTCTLVFSHVCVIHLLCYHTSSLCFPDNWCHALTKRRFGVPVPLLVALMLCLCRLMCFLALTFRSGHFFFTSDMVWLSELAALTAATTCCHSTNFLLFVMPGLWLLNNPETKQSFISEAQSVNAPINLYTELY